MTKAEIINVLMNEANDLPDRDKEKLSVLLERIENALKELHGDTAGYRADIKMIRFSPWSFHASEKEYRTSWNSGRNALLNLLTTIKHDPAIRTAEDESTPIASRLGYRSMEIEDEPAYEQPTPLKEKPPIRIDEADDLTLEFLNSKDKPVEIKAPPALELKFTTIDEKPKSSVFSKLRSLFKPKQVDTAPVESTAEPKKPEPVAETKITKEPQPQPPAETKPPVQITEPPEKESHSPIEPASEPKPEILVPAVESQEEPKIPVEVEKVPAPVEETKEEPPAPIVEAAPVSKAESPPEKPSAPPEVKIVPSLTGKTLKRVFLIHGEETPLKEKVHDALKKAGIEVAVSRDRINYSKTLMQKLTEFSDISCAVVVLTADEFSYPKNGKPKDARQRASQEVIFEMGVFIGKFGRSNVIVLHPEKAAFEMPSKYFDAVYIPADIITKWQPLLLEKLSACGYVPPAKPTPKK